MAKAYNLVDYLQHSYDGASINSQTKVEVLKQDQAINCYCMLCSYVIFYLVGSEYRDLYKADNKY